MKTSPSPSFARRLAVLVCLALVAIAGAARAQPPPEYPPVLYNPDGSTSAICVPRYAPDGTQIGWKYACGADTPACRNAAECARNGDLLFRMGNLGRSACGDAQFWFPRAHHPLRLDPQNDLGFPPGKGQMDCMCTGRLVPGTPFVARPYALGGGRYNFQMGEVICPNNGVRLETFHTGVVPHEDDALDYCGPGRRLAHGRPAPRIHGTPTCPPAGGGCPSPPPRFGWRPGPMNGYQMCDGMTGMGMAGPLVYVGGGMTVNGFANVANENPIGFFEATGGTLVVTASGSYFLTSAGTFATGAGFFGTGGTLTAGGTALGTVALPATACVAVGTGAYLGTRYVDDATGGRISDGVATGLCAVGDTCANVLWRWWAPGCHWNYELTATSASMFGEGARCQVRGPAPTRCGGSVQAPYGDPPFEGEEAEASTGCTLSSGRPGPGWPALAGLLVAGLFGVARRRRAADRRDEHRLSALGRTP